MAVVAGFLMPHPPVIVPEVGKGDEEKAKKTVEACKKVAEMIKEIEPETIIIISPHAETYIDYFNFAYGDDAEGDLWGFMAPQVELKKVLDKNLISKMSRDFYKEEFPAGILGTQGEALDHGTLVPLYFVDQEYSEYELIKFAPSGLPLTDHYKLGMMIKDAVNAFDRKTVFIASGDLSHVTRTVSPYGFAKEGPAYDKFVTKALEEGDFLSLLEVDAATLAKAECCGHNSCTVMAGVFDRTEIVSQKLSYEDPFGIGYGVFSFVAKGPDDERNFLDKYRKKHLEQVKEERLKEDAYVKLARETVETWLSNKKKPKIGDNIPEELRNRQSGVFVSIKNGGRLRGCIGTIEPVHSSVAEEIIENAILAATGDPRFDSVEPEEFNELSYSVDVLGTPEPVNFIDDLDEKRYGVIVKQGIKRGLLLPDLEGVDSPLEQIDIAKKKAGITEGDVELERFEVIRHV